MSKQKKTPKKPAKKSQSKKEKNLESNEQVERLADDLKRAQADLINYKRRSEVDKQAMAQFGKKQTLLSLLPVLDNLQRALGNKPDDIADHDWVKGVAATYEQILKDIKKLGLEQVQAVDIEFDPLQHEAVAVTGEGETDFVAEELQAGYKLDDEVIRPAMVKVERR